ncbi:hypothetical protein ACM39_10585 [Chryseobacterium sp. FH2]|uniref:hypothetical protein n=1 Tax=Chryseobacterium sp. FH2 TaxID=1674291 RepID=UPI00065B075E|nr:hypothetical protein [Chryseobacterium sp. FH2]KMQ67792.1 hypothetical protein ACM39_10585 [Chryseobacterium sp. FH2]
MNIEQLKKQLDEKQLRHKELFDFLYFKQLPQDEYDKFNKENIHLFEEYRKLSEEIRALKLELMTPEEKLEYYRQKELAKEKYKNS